MDEENNTVNKSYKLRGLCLRKHKGVYSLTDTETGEMIAGVKDISLKTEFENGIFCQTVNVVFDVFGLD